MRFLLDENVHQGLIPVLREIGHDVIVCHFEPLKKAILDLFKERSSHDRFAGMLFLLWEEKVEVSPFSLS